MNTIQAIINSITGTRIESYLRHFNKEDWVFNILLWGDIIVYFVIQAGVIFLLWHFYKWIISKTDLNKKQASNTEAATNAMQRPPVGVQESVQGDGFRVTGDS